MKGRCMGLVRGPVGAGYHSEVVAVDDQSLAC